MIWSKMDRNLRSFHDICAILYICLSLDLTLVSGRPTEMDNNSTPSSSVSSSSTSSWSSFYYSPKTYEKTTQRNHKISSFAYLWPSSSSSTIASTTTTISTRSTSNKTSVNDSNVHFDDDLHSDGNQLSVNKTVINSDDNQFQTKQSSVSDSSITSSSKLYYYSPETYGKTTHKNHKIGSFNYIFPTTSTPTTTTTSTTPTPSEHLSHSYLKSKVMYSRPDSVYESNEEYDQTTTTEKYEPTHPSPKYPSQPNYRSSNYMTTPYPSKYPRQPNYQSSKYRSVQYQPKYPSPQYPVSAHNPRPIYPDSKNNNFINGQQNPGVRQSNFPIGSNGRPFGGSNGLPFDGFNDPSIDGGFDGEGNQDFEEVRTGTWLGPGIAGLIIGIIPIATLIASMIPAFVSIPVSSTLRRRRDVSNEILAKIKLKPEVLWLMNNTHTLEDEDCLMKMLCTLAAEGKSSHKNLVQNFFYYLIDWTPDRWAEWLSVDRLFRAVKQSKCENTYRCMTRKVKLKDFRKYDN